MHIGRWLTCCGLVVAVACGPKKPPPDFAPDPMLLQDIQSLHVTTTTAGCPGQSIAAEYAAVLRSGQAIPFDTKYDKDHPPPLHTVFLRRTSREAYALDHGGWHLANDPLVSVMGGFQLATEMRHKPLVADTTVVAPEYSCLPDAFAFQGPGGERGAPGLPGPDVVVRLDILTSPFYQELLVAEIKVGAAPPFYIFHDAALMPSSDFLQIISAGGPGGRGHDGTAGAAGADGSDGCPAGAGGAGGAGSKGEAGGPGGPGGPMTIVVSQERSYLSQLVDARSPAGRPGPGGNGGAGGQGGAGGAGKRPDGTTCTDGPAGPAGQAGDAGPSGRSGPAGARVQILTVPADQVFGPRAPLPIRELIQYTSENR